MQAIIHTTYLIVKTMWLSDPELSINPLLEEKFGKAGANVF